MAYVRTRLLGPALLLALLARPASAEPAADLGAALQTFGQQVGGAVMQVMRGDLGAASAELGNAAATLDQVRALATDPALAAELGRLTRRVARGINGLQGPLARAQAAVESGRSTTKKLKALKMVYARGLNVAGALGRPIIAELNSRTAGFHHPGDAVTFRVYAADGSPCNETPTVTVENQFGAAAVDLSTVEAHADGTITMRMGTEGGGARVTVTACGKSSSRLLFNYGEKTTDTVPPNLPTGAYQLSFSASGSANVPETPLGTLVNTDPRGFARLLLSTLQQAAAAYTPPECSTSVRSSPFDGVSFTVSFSATCTVDQASASETVVFTIRRL